MGKSLGFPAGPCWARLPGGRCPLPARTALAAALSAGVGTRPVPGWIFFFYFPGCSKRKERGPVLKSPPAL